MNVLSDLKKDSSGLMSYCYAFFLANFRCTYRSGSSGITQLLVDVDRPGQAFVSVWPRPPTTRIKVAAQKQAKSWDHSLQLY